MLRSRMVIAVWLVVVALCGQAVAVPVEVTVAEVAKNATLAKEKAIASAEKQAFVSYVTQHAPTQAEKILSVYSDEKIGQFVQGYEVVNEKITDRAYRATLKVDVNEAAIDALFATAKQVAAPAPLTEDERQVGAILALPVTKDANGILLWEADNNWRDAFNEAALQRGYGRLVMPYGDPTDRLIIDASNVTTAGFGMLSSLARRYGASDILVAIMQPALDDPSKSVQVDLRFLSANQQTKQQVVQIAGEAKENHMALLNRAATKIVDGLAKQAEMARRAENGEAPLPRATLNAVLPLSDVRDWAELQNRLQKIQVVESIDVLMADWQQVTMALTYRGTPETLGQQLARANIHVQQGDNALRLAIR